MLLRPHNHNVVGLLAKGMPGELKKNTIKIKRTRRTNQTNRCGVEKLKIVIQSSNKTPRKLNKWFRGKCNEGKLLSLSIKPNFGVRRN